MDAEDRFKIALAAAVLAVDLVALAALGMPFDWPSTLKVAVTWPFLMLVAWFYTVRRPEPGIARAVRETAHLLLFSAAAAVLSYLATAVDRPLIDDWLVAADRFLGFDWTAYVAFVNQRAWLGDLSSAVYISTLPQVAMAAIVLPLIGRSEDCREMVLAVMLAALTAIAVSAVLPSAGALATFRPDASFYLASQPVVDLAYKDAFFQMRAHTLPLISLSDTKGLIAFPSYHVALSVLIVLAFRRMPVLFWPLLLLNFGVVLATPVDGGHHLIDGIGGIVLAVASLAVAIRLRKALRRTTNEALDSSVRPGIGAVFPAALVSQHRQGPLES